MPVKTILPLIKTFPVLLLVSVAPPDGVTVPPKVILNTPVRAWLAVKAAAPVPLLKVAPFITIPPPKLVAGFWPERFQVAPALIITCPVNVFVPVAAVAVVTVPLAPWPTVVTPDTTMAPPASTRVPPLLILSVVQAAATETVTECPFPILTMSPATGKAPAAAPPKPTVDQVVLRFQAVVTPVVKYGTAFAVPAENAKIRRKIREILCNC